MSKASKESFLKINDTGARTSIKKKVYNYIKRNENTHIYNMKRDLNISHQTLTARISDLLDEGKIEISETKKTSFSETKLSSYKVQENIDLIRVNIFNRNKEGFKKWLKKVPQYEALLSEYTMEDLLKNRIAV